MTVHAVSSATEPWRSKQWIAAHYGRSASWVERKMREGMPYRRDTPTSWPMFRLSEVDAWLASRE
jgi:hypothetical protein